MPRLFGKKRPKTLGTNVPPSETLGETTLGNRTDVNVCQTTSYGLKHTSCIPFINYERFNYSNFSICFWSWNYRGWHQTCPPIDTW